MISRRGCGWGSFLLHTCMLRMPSLASAGLRSSRRRRYQQFTSSNCFRDMHLLSLSGVEAADRTLAPVTLALEVCCAWFRCIFPPHDGRPPRVP